MAMHQQVRGVGDKGGIFWAGRPTTMLVLDDALVLLQASTIASLLGAQGLAGAAIQAAKQHRDAKALDAAGDDLTAERFRGQKRARVLPYGELNGAKLEGGKRSRKLVIDTSDGPTQLKYAQKLWPDGDAVPFLQARLRERFINAVS
jgi:hypothetical protein